MISRFRHLRRLLVGGLDHAMPRLNGLRVSAVAHDAIVGPLRWDGLRTCMMIFDAGDAVTDAAQIRLAKVISLDFHDDIAALLPI